MSKGNIVGDIAWNEYAGTCVHMVGGVYLQFYESYSKVDLVGAFFTQTGTSHDHLIVLNYIRNTKWCTNYEIITEPLLWARHKTY